MSLVTAASCLLFAVGAWGLIVNELTYRQRVRALRRFPPGHPEFWRFHAEYDRVSYSEHHLQLFFLLDPWRLYGSLTQTAMSKARVAQ